MGSTEEHISSHLYIEQENKNSVESCIIWSKMEPQWMSITPTWKHFKIGRTQHLATNHNHEHKDNEFISALNKQQEVQHHFQFLIGLDEDYGASPTSLQAREP